MNWLLSGLREIYGLFVDDERYALSIVIWVLFATLALPRLPIGETGRAPLLFLGLVVILVQNVWASSRRLKG